MIHSVCSPSSTEDKPSNGYNRAKLSPIAVPRASTRCQQSNSFRLFQAVFWKNKGEVAAIFAVVFLRPCPKRQ